MSRADPTKKQRYSFRAIRGKLPSTGQDVKYTLPQIQEDTKNLQSYTVAGEKLDIRYTFACVGHGELLINTADKPTANKVEGYAKGPLGHECRVLPWAPVCKGEKFVPGTAGGGGVRGDRNCARRGALSTIEQQCQAVFGDSFGEGFLLGPDVGEVRHFLYNTGGARRGRLVLKKHTPAAPEDNLIVNVTDDDETVDVISDVATSRASCSSEDGSGSGSSSRNSKNNGCGGEQSPASVDSFENTYNAREFSSMTPPPAISRDHDLHQHQRGQTQHLTPGDGARHSTCTLRRIMEGSKNKNKPSYGDAAGGLSAFPPCPGTPSTVVTDASSIASLSPQPQPNQQTQPPPEKHREKVKRMITGVLPRRLRSSNATPAATTPPNGDYNPSPARTRGPPACPPGRGADTEATFAAATAARLKPGEKRIMETFGRLRVGVHRTGGERRATEVTGVEQQPRPTHRSDGVEAKRWDIFETVMPVSSGRTPPAPHVQTRPQQKMGGGRWLAQPVDVTVVDAGDAPPKYCSSTTPAGRDICVGEDMDVDVSEGRRPRLSKQERPFVLRNQKMDLCCDGTAAAADAGAHDWGQLLSPPPLLPVVTKSISKSLGSDVAEQQQKQQQQHHHYHHQQQQQQQQQQQPQMSVCAPSLDIAASGSALPSATLNGTASAFDTTGLYDMERILLDPSPQHESQRLQYGEDACSTSLDFLKDVSEDELADMIVAAEDQDDGREMVLMCDDGNSPKEVPESRKRRRDGIKQAVRKYPKAVVQVLDTYAKTLRGRSTTQSQDAEQYAEQYAAQHDAGQQCAGYYDAGQSMDAVEERQDDGCSRESRRARTAGPTVCPDPAAGLAGLQEVHPTNQTNQLTPEGQLPDQELQSFRAKIASSPENSVKSLADMLLSLSSRGSCATWGSARSAHLKALDVFDKGKEGLEEAQEPAQGSFVSQEELFKRMTNEEKAQLKIQNAHLRRISETSALADIDTTLLELRLSSEAATSRGDVGRDTALHHSMVGGGDRSQGVLDRERDGQPVRQFFPAAEAVLGRSLPQFDSGA